MSFTRETRNKGTHRIKIRVWGRIHYASAEVKQSGVALLLSDKEKVQTDIMKRDVQGIYIFFKGTIDSKLIISILNIYASNGIACKFLKEKLVPYIRKLEVKL